MTGNQKKLVLIELVAYCKDWNKIIIVTR